MGRTVPSFRPALEEEIKSWDDYKRGLRTEDKIVFDEIMNYSRSHADAGSLSAKPDLTQIIFMSVLLEMQKKIHKLESELNELKELNSRDKI
ncbi:MAG: hypothetical protein ACTSU2_02330 [Promethearchaeota archaeon]